MQHITNYIKNHYLLLLSLVVILIIYIFVDIRMYQTKTTPTGDEPDFLLIAHSIAYDRDINIKNNEVNKDWRNFFSEDTLVVRYGWGNYKYPLFNFGFPLVLSIPYRLGGCLGTMFFNSFLMVLLFFSIYFITCRMLNLERMNPLGIWILALSTPVFYLFLADLPRYYCGTHSPLGFIHHVLLSREKVSSCSAGVLLCHSRVFSFKVFHPDWINGGALYPQSQ